MKKVVQEIKKFTEQFALSSKERGEILGNLRQLNLKRLLVIASLVFIGEIFSFVSRCLSGVNFANSGSLFLVVGYKAAVSLSYILVSSVLLRKKREKSRAAYVSNQLFLLALVVVQLHVSRYEYLTRGTVYNFFFGLLIFLVGIIMTNGECLVFTLLYSGTMLFFLLREGALPQVVNVVVLMTLMTVVGSRLYYVSYLKTLRTTRALDSSRRQMEYLSMTDPLTEINNRRGFYYGMDYILGHGVRNGATVAFMMADIDKFKLYNDRYGHVMGDKCLQQIARCLQEVFHRKTDCIARYGGEEFVAVIAFASLRQAALQAEKFIRCVQELGIEHLDNPNGQVVTISAGLHFFVPSKDSGVEEVLRCADLALYQSKAAGGNCLTIYETPGETQD